jgi:hypothetical protein
VATGILTRRTCSPGTGQHVPGAPGRRAAGAASSDDREGMESERGVLPYKTVHGCLERAGNTVHRRIPLTGWRGQGRGDPVHSCAPESRTGCTSLGPLYRQIMGSDLFNFNEFRGVNDSRHGVPP